MVGGCRHPLVHGKHLDMDANTKKILAKLDKLMRSGNKETAKFVADEAISYFSRKMENLDRVDQSKERDWELAEINKYLGDVHRIMGDYETSLGYYQKMKDLSKGLGKSKFVVDAYISMGEIFKLRGEWEDALNSFNKGLRTAKSSQYEHGEAEAGRLLGYVNWRLGRFKKAEEFYKWSLKLAEGLNDKHVQGKIFIELGNLENETGDLDQAQTYYNKALKLLEPLDDKYELARIYNNMGDICIKRQDWESGIRYFEKCHNIARKLRDPRWKGWALFNAAECYSKNGKPSKAEEYCERAERALSHTEDKMARAYVQINYGIAFRFLGEWSISEEHFLRGLDLLEELKSPSVLAWAYTEYSHMNHDRGEREKAMTYLQKAISMYRRVGAKKYIQDLTTELATWRKG